MGVTMRWWQMDLRPACGVRHFGLRFAPMVTVAWKGYEAPSWVRLPATCRIGAESSRLHVASRVFVAPDSQTSAVGLSLGASRE